MKATRLINGLMAARIRFKRWYRQGLGRLGTEPYLPLSYLLLCCVPIAVLIVIVGKKMTWLKYLLVNHPEALLLSFLYSYLIAALLTFFAHWCNRWLDARVDWNTEFNKRLASQMLLPLAGGWALGMLLAAALLAVKGTGIMASGYFRFEVWIVLLLLATMNAGYGFWYIYRHRDTPQRGITHVHVTDADGRRISISVLRIGYIAAHYGGAIIHTTGGKKYDTRDRVNYLAKKLHSNRFLMLKRRYLINISIIKAVEQVKRVKTDPDGMGAGGTEVVYRHMLVFGNSNIKERREPLVKGTLKQVKEWLERNAHLR